MAAPAGWGGVNARFVATLALPFLPCFVAAKPMNKPLLPGLFCFHAHATNTANKAKASQSACAPKVLHLGRHALANCLYMPQVLYE
jgi:hypothetical protein